jgi:hypothetical protein
MAGMAQALKGRNRSHLSLCFARVHPSIGGEQITTEYTETRRRAKESEIPFIQDSGKGALAMETA